MNDMSLVHRNVPTKLPSVHGSRGEKRCGVADDYFFLHHCPWSDCWERSAILTLVAVNIGITFMHRDIIQRFRSSQCTSAFGSDDAGLNLGLVLMPSLPPSAGFSPALHTLLILDPVDQVMGLYQLAVFVELKCMSFSSTVASLCLSCLHRLGCLPQSCRIRRESWAVPSICSTQSGAD